VRELSVANNPAVFPRMAGNWRPIIWLTAAGIAALVPAIIFGVPSNIDLSNHFRFALPFYEAIHQGNFYPGWLAESNYGYGDPSFRFYPPGLYYLLAIARIVSGNWYVATLSVITLLSVIGALGVYFWARQFLPSQVAIWAGIFYVLAPYHLNQLYQAFMLAEFAGAAVLPFLLVFTERVCRRGRGVDIAGLAISIAALVFTHLPLSVIALLTLGFYALLRAERGRRLRAVIQLALAIALGLAASACYWATMVAELYWIRVDHMKADPSVDFRRNFVFSTFSPENLNVWWMNILVFASVAMFWPCVVIFRRFSDHKSSVAGPRAAAIVAIFSFFMTSPLSRPVWTIVSPLQRVQFPWRWLIVTSMASSLALAAAIPLWWTTRRDRKRPLALLVLGTVIVSVAFSGLHTVREANYLDAAQFEATLRQIPGSTSVSLWWPVWVNEPWKEMNNQVEAGPRTLSIKSWSPEERTFKVGAGAAIEARVRTFFYPHWVATAQGKRLEARPAGDGALMISIPANETVVNLEFREPPRVFGAALITAMGWIAIMSLAVSNLKRFRRRNSRPESSLCSEVRLQANL